MTRKEEVCYYPGRGLKVEIVKRGIETEWGVHARVRFMDGTERDVPEALLAYPVSERKKNASE